MVETLSAQARLLELFFEVLGAERGRSKARIRRMDAYRELGERAFESQFQRDKDALRQIGVDLRVGAGPDGDTYSISPGSFARVGARLNPVQAVLVGLALQAWSPSAGPKVAAASDGSGAPDLLRMDLTGVRAAADFATGIRERRVVSFDYEGAQGTTERSVEPWRIVVRGRALYLWGFDLDRGEDRLFRISRVASAVSFLGQAGDADEAPARLDDPFADRRVAPVLAVLGDPGRLARHLDGPMGGELPSSPWRLWRGREADVGRWISRVLARAEDVVVVEPVELRDAVLRRLEAAARLDGDRGREGDNA
ncbi:helix-turn-helix transcriptional regulator [Schaalia georgiae]|uniref:helix-turn-helix transcriptional regulator n=1 Tax=Schaalia georgiae TaxID=52768 RepID=UPI000418129F|nr:WYL domain-containing protein [Schaalia georgiae]